MQLWLNGGSAACDQVDYAANLSESVRRVGCGDLLTVHHLGPDGQAALERRRINTAPTPPRSAGMVAGGRAEELLVPDGVVPYGAAGFFDLVMAKVGLVHSVLAAELARLPADGLPRTVVWTVSPPPSLHPTLLRIHGLPPQLASTTPDVPAGQDGDVVWRKDPLPCLRAALAGALATA